MPDPAPTDPAKDDAIQQIARELLHLETLETRNRDHLDFKEQAVWQIAEALDAAYEAGRAAGRPKRRKTNPNHPPRP